MLRPTRRALPPAIAVVIALLALPLLAPTCGQTGAGLRTFSKRSIIIPMDACYQGDGTTVPTGCPGAADPGKLLYGYGLVYQLLQNNITVYWVIAPTKAALTTVDLTVQFNAGAPVGKYDWATGTYAARPPNNSTSTVNYRGGPFVIDGADYDAVNALLQGPLKAQFSGVNLHVSNVAFTGNAARAMNGGWKAGGTVPPPIALLNLTGGDCKNSLSTVRQYLKDAGLGNLPNAGGTATGTHGTIYDVLDYQDFLPDLPNSNLGKNGYRVLWAPHWVAKWSCTTTCQTNSTGTLYCPTQLTTAQIDGVRSTIKNFVANGQDFFSECSSIGAVEGDANYCDTAAITTNAATGRIATTGGLNINAYGWDYQCLNKVSGQPSRTYYPNFTPLTFTQFGSPLMQLGDFRFTANSGAIANYQPMAGTSWVANTQHLIADTSAGWDVFTVKPGASGAGTTVYLAGHDYSTIGNPYQLAGSRLVLNTLFNLGSGCVSTGTDCQTGQLGECGKGKLQCVNGAPTCVQVTQPANETCDNLDNDCNGLVDDGLAKTCYSGPAGTAGVGECQSGTSTCAAGVWSGCQGEVKPKTEICNGRDDDCDTRVDDGVANQACYGGPVGTAGVGICKAGTQACTAGTWGACQSEVRPNAETCGNGVDDNCDGAVDEGCGCQTGQTQPCYGGPGGTAGVGVCRAGSQACASGAWGACQGEVKPSAELCNGKDDDCDGQTDEDGVCDECKPGQTRPCYTGPSGTSGVGLCKPGVQPCDAGKWGACESQVLPASELCDGKDNDCDGVGDDGATCPPTFACSNGVCVPDHCGGELGRCPEGYACTAGKCAVSKCGAVTCPAGQRCAGGVCEDPCASVQCGQGATCAGGVCTAGGCYEAGCPTGKVCAAGACVSDICTAMSCPAGSFCRDGYCVQSCAFVTCATGKQCSADGLCVDDPCAAQSCGAGKKCVNGSCVTDPCANLSCGTGQVCVNGACKDDPCNLVNCPVGTCVGGQCFGGLLPRDGGFPDAGPDGGVAEPPDAGEDPFTNIGNDKPDAGAPIDPGTAAAPTGCGCATSSSGGLGFGALLLVLFAPSVRRQRKVGAGGLACTPPRVAAEFGLAAVLVMSALALLTACGNELPETLPPGTCNATSDCGVSETCVANKCEAMPPDASEDIHFDLPDAGPPPPPPCEMCGTGACVDLLVDTARCGSCTNVCGAQELCVDGKCGPKDPVGPALTSLSPVNTPQTPNLTLDVRGERFKSGAKLHVVGLGGADLATTFVDAKHLTATLDVSQVDPGTLEVRVVNPDRVISNALPMTVTAATPSITSISPTSAVRGGPVKIRVNGSGFVRASLCKVSGTGFPEQGLTTTFVSPAALDCTFDLTNVQPGTFSLVVVSSGTLRSNTKTFTVKTATPVLTALSPNGGRPGAKISVTATGTGFDNTSVLRFRGAALPTTFVSSTQLFASPLDLTSLTSGTYPVDVLNNGTVASNVLDFTVTSNTPSLTSITPTAAIQGTQFTLTATGTFFESGSVLQLFNPSNVKTSLTTTYVSGTQLTAIIDLTGKTAGVYRVQVVNPGNLASNSLTLEVQSNVAVLTSIAPAGGAQGTTVSLQVTGENFLSAAKVFLGGNGRTNAALTTVWNSSTSLSVNSLSLAGWETGTYSVTVVNPNAVASNAVSFTVFAGQPTLTSVTPSSATQGPTVSVTLRGTNFAKPNASGSGGSTVHATAPALAISDAVVPCTVSSATTITCSVDTTASPPGSYSISVWNPGGNPPPMKSNALTFTLNP